MKILLISPASGRWRRVGRGRLAHGKTFRFSMLSLLTVAAETPPGVEIQIIDEQVEEIPWDAPVDLVGITAMTAAAPRAYEIAAQYRARGVPTVLGGMHATLCPLEALDHVDAVVSSSGGPALSLLVGTGLKGIAMVAAAGLVSVVFRNVSAARRTGRDRGDTRLPAFGRGRPGEEPVRRGGGQLDPPQPQPRHLSREPDRSRHNP